MVLFFLFAAAGLLALLIGCQSRLIYYPRSYADGFAADWAAASGGKVLQYRTSQGVQHAFLMGNRQRPQRLWLVCGGNASLALDWSDWLRANAKPGDAWLLADYPGYGGCEGAPTPGRIRESLRELLPLAARETGLNLPADAGRLRFFAHSLGGAAALIAACDSGVQRGVLLAPFTSTMEMARRMTGLPLGPLVWHRYDNQARLTELEAAGKTRIVIVHGVRDEVIPVAMARALAAAHPDSVRLIEVPEAGHNNLHHVAGEELRRAMREVE